MSASSMMASPHAELSLCCVLLSATFGTDQYTADLVNRAADGAASGLAAAAGRPAADRGGLGRPVPLATLERLRALQPSAAEITVFRRLTSRERPVAQRFWTDLSGMGGWRARLDYAASALFPSPAYMRRRYGVRHPHLLPLYYPYRWWVGLRGLIARRRVSG